MHSVKLELYHSIQTVFLTSPSSYPNPLLYLKSKNHQNTQLSQSTVLPPLAEPQSSRHVLPSYTEPQSSPPSPFVLPSTQSSRPVSPSYTEPQSSPPSPFVLPSTQPLIEPPSSNQTPTNSLNLSIDPPPPTNEHSDSPSISNETTTTNGLTDHLNISSSSDSRIQSVRILTSPEYLRDFFADILKKESPFKNIKQRRKQLTGHGESLTSDEAMEVLRKEEEEKTRLAAEKAEKKRQREEKRREKQEKKNQSETSRRGRPKKRKNDDGDVDYESTKKRKNDEDYETIKKRISRRPKKSDHDDFENKENEVTKDDSENEDTNEEKSGIPLAICPSCNDTDDDSRLTGILGFYRVFKGILGFLGYFMFFKVF